MTKSLLFLLLLMAGHFSAIANNQPEKIKPRVRLNFTNHIGNRAIVEASAYYKLNKKKTYCVGATVGFYTDEDYENLQSKAIVNESGNAILELNNKDLLQFEDSTNQFHFYARLEEDSSFKARKADLKILNAYIEVKFNKKDTLSMISARFIGRDKDSSTMNPQKKVPVRFFVERVFSPLTIGDEFTYTDDDGYAETRFPNDIPGDEHGNLNVIIKVEEDDNYGTVVIKQTINWGLPTQIHNPVGEGSLIGNRDNAPWFMIIGINAMLLAVWGYLFYIVAGLLKIKKLGNKII